MYLCEESKTRIRAGGITGGEEDLIHLCILKLISTERDHKFTLHGEITSISRGKDRIRVFFFFC